MKKNIRQIKYSVGIILISIVLGFALIVAAYMIPTEKIKNNVRVSSTQMQDEGGYYQWAKYYFNTQIDTCTDGYLLLAAMYSNEESSLIQTAKDAMNNPAYGIPGDNELSVYMYSHDELNNMEETSYGRYWHGLLVLLKPYLFFFDLADLRIFLMIINMSLICFAAIGFYKRKLKPEGVAFFTALIFINPITMTECICFSVEFILMMLACILILYKNEFFIQNYRYLYFFLILGILYCYLDELSFSFIGYAFPMIIILVMNHEKWSQSLKRQIVYGVAWAGGYILMWLGKWIISSVLTGYNYVKEAFNQVLYFTVGYANDKGYDHSAYERIIKNLLVYLKWPFLLCYVLAIIIIFIQRRKKNVFLPYTAKKDFIPMLLMSILPFAIIILMGNGYSYTHFWFSHRCFSISVFASLCLMIMISKTRNKIV